MTPTDISKIMSCVVGLWGSPTISAEERTELKRLLTPLDIDVESAIEALTRLAMAEDTSKWRPRPGQILRALNLSKKDCRVSDEVACPSCGGSTWETTYCPMGVSQVSRVDRCKKCSGTGRVQGGVPISEEDHKMNRGKYLPLLREQAQGSGIKKMKQDTLPLNKTVNP